MVREPMYVPLPPPPGVPRYAFVFPAVDIPLFLVFIAFHLLHDIMIHSTRLLGDVGEVGEGEWREERSKGVDYRRESRLGRGKGEREEGRECKNELGRARGVAGEREKSKRGKVKREKKKAKVRKCRLKIYIQRKVGKRSKLMRKYMILGEK